MLLRPIETTAVIGQLNFIPRAADRSVTDDSKHLSGKVKFKQREIHGKEDVQD